MGGKPKDFNGAKLRKQREKRGWSQAGLSKLSGVSDEYISQLENGSNVPNELVCQKLSTALGVAVSELFGPEEECRKSIEFKVSDLGNLFDEMGMW
jgi:transcriptional regulator with XRE-family HTH domain